MTTGGSTDEPHAHKPTHGATAAQRRAVGAYGERVAARALTESGMRIVDRNWRCRDGELDIVALDGECLVFCEVKTRRSTSFGTPVEAVTRAKAQRLRRLAGLWLAEQTDRASTAYQQIRIDVLAVTCPRSGPALVSHLRGVC